jgi:hypothetical protein
MKINYRPEIDGLRAIAVIAVIFYHAKINFFGYHFLQGGFIGVDIFFVISGYLITLIILKEFIVSGTFQFKYFYERRARRILPALLLMILLSIPVAYIYLLPNSFVDFSKSIFYILGLIQIFIFIILVSDMETKMDCSNHFLILGLYLWKSNITFFSQLY